jgi:large repetitive protein
MMLRRTLVSAVAVAVVLALAPTALAAGWSSAGSMSNARYRQTATLLSNGEVLVAGGIGSSGAALASAELYQPSTGTWSATGSMITPRQGQTATVLPNGKVLVAGGVNAGGTAVATAELYDPSTGTWSSTGAMSSARYYATATLLGNGKVLVAGGFISSGIYLKSAELYDPSTGSWSSTGSMATGRDHFTATLLPSGKVLVAGGNITDCCNTAAAELYDPSTGAWSTAGSMSSARANQTATLLGNGKVLVAGGFDNGPIVSSVDVYDPSSGTWSPTGSMTAARANQTATLLPSGEVLVAGGSNSSGVIATSELYDPSTGTWSAAGSMSNARTLDTATLLSDGNVLVTGGSSTSGVTKTADLYGILSPSLSMTAPGTGIAGSPISPSSLSAALAGGNSPTGSITFTVFGPAADPPTSCTSGGTTVGTATLSGNGSYRPVTGFKPSTAGNYWWYASYGGDGNNYSATSACGSLMAETRVAPPAPPTLTVAHQADGQNGWNVSSPVAEVVSASDSVSGLAGAPSCTVDGNPASLSGGNGAWSLVLSGDGRHQVSCSVSNNAGAKASASDSVAVDTTPPSLSVSNQPTGSHGWNTSSPVTEMVIASDPSSGVAGAPVCTLDGNPVTLSGGHGDWTFEVPGDGQHPVSCNASDAAGNQSTASDLVKIDATGPVLTAVHQSDGQNGWNVGSSVQEVVTASDSGSGLAGAPTCTEGGLPVTLTGGDGSWSFQASGDGTYAIDCQVSDSAGNRSTAPDAVEIDSTAPSVSVSNQPTGSDGWNTSSPVTETVAASDSGSGLAGAPVCTLDGNPVTLTGGDGSWTFQVAGDGQHSASCQASDEAGNGGTGSDTAKVDTTSPALTVSHSADGQTGWNVKPVTETVAASDSGSGLAGAPSCTVDNDPATLSGGNGSWSFQVSGDGTHAIACQVTDAAGSQSKASDSVKLDATAPSLSVTHSADGQNGWNVNEPVTETVAASDSGSGLAGQPSCTDKDGNPVALTVGSSDGSWTFPVSGDGQHSFSCSAADNAGNQASGKDTVQIDTSAPSTSASGVPAGWVNNDVTVTLNATDPNPGSGVAGTYYTVDGGSQQSGGSVSVPAPAGHSDDGTHTVAYWSVDSAGNAESQNSATVKIDTIAPAISFGGGYANGGFAAAGTPAQVSIGDPSDPHGNPGSGVDNAKTTYTLDGNPYTAGSPITAVGPHTLVVSACDHAGNCSRATTKFTVFAYANGGNFVVGDQTVGSLDKATGLQVTFWGAQWAKSNQLSGGSAPASFKGFEDSQPKAACGQSWTTDPGNSSSPPSSVPGYIAVIVSSTIGKSGSTISGDTQHVVIVKTNAGYGANPGQAGTGTIVGSLC